METKLYTQPDCPDCAGVRKWLADNGVEYQEMDVTASSEIYSISLRAALPSWPEHDAERELRCQRQSLFAFVHDNDHCGGCRR